MFRHVRVDARCGFILDGEERDAGCGLRARIDEARADDAVHRRTYAAEVERGHGLRGRGAHLGASGNEPVPLRLRAGMARLRFVVLLPARRAALVQRGIAPVRHLGELRVGRRGLDRALDLLASGARAVHLRAGLACVDLHQHVAGTHAVSLGHGNTDDRSDDVGGQGAGRLRPDRSGDGVERRHRRALHRDHRRVDGLANGRLVGVRARRKDERGEEKRFKGTAEHRRDLR
jgi:hypothetical protein